MMVPGSNLLDLAGTLIAFQKGTLYRWMSTTQDAAGRDVATYGGPQSIVCSQQAVPRSMFEQWGLDLQRNYIMLYTDVVLHDLKRDATPDKVVYNGRAYTVESNTDWQNQDGWQGSLCVDVGPAT